MNLNLCLQEYRLVYKNTDQYSKSTIVLFYGYTASFYSNTPINTPHQHLCTPMLYTLEAQEGP